MESTQQPGTLIKRLSQDMWEAAWTANNSRAVYPSCDSSDCLVCQGQRTFCSRTVTDQVCSWLERRLSAPTAASDAGSACQAAEEGALEPQRKRRLKRVASDMSEDSNSVARACSALSTIEENVQTHCYEGRTWAWREEWADRESPAPCQMVEVASLRSAAESCGTAGANRRHDMICGLEFSPDGQLLAAAGVSKQVALYQLSSLQSQQLDVQQQPRRQAKRCGQQRKQQKHAAVSLPSVASVRLSGKVSSIAWCPDMEGVLSIGDYDGTLTQVHVASGHYLSEVDGHGGRRIWSICHSQFRPDLAATASDDSTAKLWAGRGFSTAVATITLPGKPAVCGVDFSQHEGNLLALAAADAKVYLFDLRQLSEPLLVLHGHRRPVSYAKFFGPGQLVSASTDGTVAAWKLGDALGVNYSSTASDGASSEQAGTTLPHGSACSSSTVYGGAQQHHNDVEQQLCNSNVVSGHDRSHVLQPWKVFRGHMNEKNFVGLSVLPSAGLMAVGSESGEVFTYHTSWSDPLARFSMHDPQLDLQQHLRQPAVAKWSQPQQRQQQQSVCAVAWRPSGVTCGTAPHLGSSGSSDLLAASTSTGICRLLALVDPL